MDPLHLEMVTESPKGQANLTVIGLGGAGGNAVRRMIDSSLTGVNYIVANTDAQALRDSPAPTRLQIGEDLTGGLGSGGDPRKGRLATEESKEQIAQALQGSDMVFIAAGMGGGTGTGASPLVAELAKSSGALTVAIVTRPFIFEGRPRVRVAEEGLGELQQHVDTLIVIPNQRLLSIASQETTYTDAMKLADEVLVNATRGITDIILRSGDINVDFADVRAVMENKGNALMGLGRASGADRAIQAATAAISSPLLNEVSIDGAEAILVNVTGGPGMTLHEVADATSVIVNAAGEQAEVIFGTVVDPALEDEILITLIATGFGEREKRVLPLKESGRPAARAVPTVDPLAGEPVRPERRETVPVGSTSREEPADDVIEDPEESLLVKALAGFPAALDVADDEIVPRSQEPEPVSRLSSTTAPRARRTPYLVSREDRPIFMKRHVE